MSRWPLWRGFVGSVEYGVGYDGDSAVEAKTSNTSLRLKCGYQW